MLTAADAAIVIAIRRSPEICKQLSGSLALIISYYLFTFYLFQKFHAYIFIFMNKIAQTYICVSFLFPHLLPKYFPKFMISSHSEHTFITFFRYSNTRKGKRPFIIYFFIPTPTGVRSCRLLLF